MQFVCLDCGKRLRVGDQHVNPKVRCPNCGCVFRPAETAAAANPGRSASDRSRIADKAKEPARRAASQSRPVKRPQPKRPPKKNMSGAIGFALMMLIMFGPRLVRQFVRPQPDRREIPAAGEMDPIRERLERPRPPQLELPAEDEADEEEAPGKDGDEDQPPSANLL